MSQYTHTCVKCTKSYQDEDVEAYYCPECLAEHKAMAAVIDSKREPSTNKQMGDLESLMNDPRTIIKNGVDGHGVRGQSIFFRESQL